MVSFKIGGACMLSSACHCSRSFCCIAMQRSSSSLSLLYCSCFWASESMTSMPFALVTIRSSNIPACKAACWVSLTSSSWASTLCRVAMSLAEMPKSSRLTSCCPSAMVSTETLSLLFQLLWIATASSEGGAVVGGGVVSAEAPLVAPFFFAAMGLWHGENEPTGGCQSVGEECLRDRRTLQQSGKSVV